MDKKNTLIDPRFSLSVSQVQNPIAESTCVNLNGTRSVPHFQWGGTPLSFKNRSNSSSCLVINDKIASPNANKISTTNSQNLKTSSRIDPRIYADVQSKGLASRIVKYHDNGSNLNRSMSLNNLYTKPCSFPVVHLNKTDAPYKATQQTLSMTRIAPPQKSMFYGNTLSSLLRSNSVIGLHKSDVEISHENRPIMHPPVTESELAPTRSVLDVLKEISRKRISSDQLDSNEVVKKYCNRDKSSLDVLNNVQVSQGRSADVSQSYKRQREHHSISPQNLIETHTSSMGAGNLRVQLSPEQIAKKRVCNYNNDITSSLSSSLIQASKRKSYDQRCALNYSTDSKLLAEDNRTHRAKLHCRYSEMSLPKPLICNVPTTSNKAKQLNPTVHISQRAASAQLHIVTPPQHVSPPVKSISNDIGPASTPTANKPRLTLFNKTYDESTEAVTMQRTDNLNSDNSEYGDVPFVKPKKSSSITNTKNPLIERTQKSKLALMLSALRGELYQGEEDEIDADIQPQREKAPESTFTTSSVLMIPNPSPLTSVTLTKITTSVTNTASSNTDITNTTTVKSANVPKVTAISPTISATTSATAVTTTVGVSSSLSVGGFKFTPPVSTSLASSPPSSTKMSSPLVGIKLTPQKSPPMLTATSSAPMFSFGVPSTNTAVTSSNTATSSAPMFSFGTPTNNAVTSSNTATSSAPMFSFGQPTVTSSNAAFKESLVTSKTPAVPSLGGFAFSNGTTIAKIVPTSTTTQSANTKNVSVGFTLTSSTSATSINNQSTSGAVHSQHTDTTITDTCKPTYCFGSPTTAIITATSKVDSVAPSFGATLAASNLSTASAASSFGSATNAPIFGSITSSSTTPTTTAFRSTNNALNMTQVESKPFSLPSDTPAAIKTTATSNIFGGISNTVNGAKPFAFGSPNSGLPATTNISSRATNTSTTAFTPAVTSAFSFGTPAQKPLAATAPFSFGGSAPYTVEAAAPVKNSFMFGSVAPVSTPTTTFGTGGLFSFANGNSTTTNISNCPITNNNFAHNTGTTNTGFGQTSNSVFGDAVAASNAITNTGNTMATATSTQSATSFFGSTTTLTQPTKLATFGSTAGSSSTPFALGSRTSSPAASVAFTFGGAAGETAVATRAPNIFDSTTANTSVPATGIVKPSFSFGGNAMTTMNPTKSTSFGLATTSNNVNNSFKPLDVVSNTTQSKSFGFGASSSSISSMPVTNVFRSSSAINTKSAVDNFNFVNATNSTTFCSSNNTAGDAFQFGTAAIVKPESTTINKPFTFGNNSTTNTSVANGTNMFGTALNTTKPTTPVFNFNAADPSATQQPPNTNMFAPPGDRPIRRATRRLHKS